MSRHRSSVLVFVVALLIAACQASPAVPVASSGPTAAPKSSPSPTPVPAATASPVPTRAPTPAPTATPDPEAAFLGDWQQVGSNLKFRFERGRNLKYRQPGDLTNGYNVIGSTAITADQIVFSNSNRCPGTGTYAWALSGDNIKFTPVDQDPCPRSASIPNPDG